jgi:hypothetical protein
MVGRSWSGVGETRVSPGQAAEIIPVETISAGSGHGTGGLIELSGAESDADRRVDAVRYAPGFSVIDNTAASLRDRPYIARSIGVFLGWLLGGGPLCRLSSRHDRRRSLAVVTISPVVRATPSEPAG